MDEAGMRYELALYYERVSTQHMEQDESMENQRALGVSFLKRHPEIRLAEPMDTYSERVSGKSDARPKYQKMLRRLEKGDIRYVLVKDFKRLNRSTELAAQISNHAKEYNYQFILLSTGQVFDPNAEQNRMLYGFESLLNQEVVYRQSEYGRLAHRQKCEARRLNQNNLIFGYAWDVEKKDIVIDEEKADVIKGLYNLYVFQDYGIPQLRKYLADRGYHYSANTVANWLAETAFVGVFHINKKGSELGVGAGKKTRRYTNPKDEWIPVERPDLAIIDKDIFNLAQKIRENRNRHFNPAKRSIRDKCTKEIKRTYEYRQDRFRGTHLFSSKVYCKECGYPFVHGYADRAKKVGIYRDTFKSRSRDPLQECGNTDYKRIYEEDLIEAAIIAINGMIQENQECFLLLMSALEKVIQEDDTQQIQMKEKNKEILRLTKAADNILKSFPFASGALLTDLNQKYNEIKAKILEVEAEMAAVRGQGRDEKGIQKQLEAISHSIDKWRTIDHDNIDRKMIDAFIEKIFVGKDGALEIFLNTSRIIEAQLPMKKKGRSQKSSSPSFMEISLSYKYSLSDYAGQVKELLESLWSGKAGEGNLTMIKFQYTEKVGNRRTKKRREFEVAVEIIIGTYKGAQ